MAKKWNTLLHKMPAERRKRVMVKTAELDVAIRLAQLRAHRGMTQAQLAQRMHVTASALSQIEHGQNMKIATIKRMIEGMGGQMRIVAEFTDEKVAIG